MNSLQRVSAKLLLLGLPLAGMNSGVAKKGESEQPKITRPYEVVPARADYDMAASRQGIDNLLIYIGDDISNANRRLFIRNSGIQIAPAKILFQESPEQDIRKIFKENGIAEKDLEIKVKEFEALVERFNTTSTRYKHFVIDFDNNMRERLTETLPVLKPKESPHQTIEKYPGAKYGFPVILDEKNTPDLGDIDIDEIQLRYYRDPKSGKIEKGIHIKYGDSYKRHLEEKPLSEEDRTRLLIPELGNVVLMPRKDHDVIIIVRRPFFKPSLFNN